MSSKKSNSDFTKEKSFWDIFNASVPRRVDLEGTEKIIYFGGLLEGETLRLTEDYNLEDQYYDEAIKLFQKTYGCKEEIKMSFMKKLLQLEGPNLDPHDQQERQPDFVCQIRLLHALNLTLNEMYTILLYQKLPSSILVSVRLSKKLTMID